MSTVDKFAEIGVDMLKVVNMLRRSMPNGDQINVYRLTDGELRFEWRGTKYLVSPHLHVEEVEDGLLVGSDSAALIRRLLEQQVLLEARP